VEHASVELAAMDEDDCFLFNTNEAMCVVIVDVDADAYRRLPVPGRLHTVEALSALPVEANDLIVPRRCGPLVAY
jgi:hypothetical protein